MATLPKEHESIYFDALIRTNKADSLLSLIKATYFAYESEAENVKEEIAKRLENAYNLFRKNIRTADSGSGTYTGTMDQFQSQYTLGHEMGIWKDSELHLTDLATKVAKNEITIKEYFRVIFLNYIQPVDGKIIHPLYFILKYMIESHINYIEKSDLTSIFGVSCEGGSANGLINLLIETNYFYFVEGRLTFNKKFSKKELLLKCNTKYLEENGYLLAKTELSNPEVYDQYLSYENKNYLFKEKSIIEIYKLFQKWITSNLNPERLNRANGYGNNLAKIFSILEKNGKINKDSMRCADLSYYEYVKEQYYQDDEARKVDEEQHFPASAAFPHYINFIKQILIFGEDYVEKELVHQDNIYYLAEDDETIGNYWLISANSKIYDHESSFDKFGEIDWYQNRLMKSISVNDIVFIYVAAPTSKVKYKCKVVAIDIPKDEAIDDSEFWLVPKKEECDKFLKLKLLGKTDDDRLLLEKLIERGLKAAPEGPVKLDKEKYALAIYINSIFEALEKEFSEVSKAFEENFEIRGDASNLIVFGTPGCGKSYYVENELLKDFNKDNIFRTTFYQDYTNTDFVGQILPYVEKDEKGKEKRVTYEFNPGPFALALKQAVLHKDEKVALVVEELNRGNAPAIFGDVFQLLDRDENGISRYSITNINLSDYLNRELNANFAKIKIPGNLYIYATMNTSDQNVFTLDTAFKRRWDSLKLKNTFDTYTDVLGYEHKHDYKLYKIPGMKDVTWQQFVNEINNAIVGKEGERDNNINVSDKQIGVYFIDKNGLYQENIDANDLNDRTKAEKFAYKVFSYLWDDVAKFDKDKLFAKGIITLDELIKKYIKHEVIFNPSLQEKLYPTVNQKDSDSSETK